MDLCLLGNSISQHQYSAAFCQGGDFPLTSFMSKAAVRGNLTIFEADIAATHEQGLVYILGYVDMHVRHLRCIECRADVWLSHV